MLPSAYSTLRSNVMLAEGLRLKPYQDTRGEWTIGYGHQIRPGDDLSPTSELTPLQASQLLDRDLGNAINDLYTAFPFTMNIDSVRQCVLAELCFNLGIGTLAQFKRMWAALRLVPPNFQDAGLEILDSEAARETGHERYPRLAAAMSTGVFQ